MRNLFSSGVGVLQDELLWLPPPSRSEIPCGGPDVKFQTLAEPFCYELASEAIDLSCLNAAWIEHGGRTLHLWPTCSDDSLSRFQKLRPCGCMSDRKANTCEAVTLILQASSTCTKYDYLLPRVPLYVYNSWFSAKRFRGCEISTGRRVRLTWQRAARSCRRFPPRPRGRSGQRARS